MTQLVQSQHGIQHGNNTLSVWSFVAVADVVRTMADLKYGVPLEWGLSFENTLMSPRSPVGWYGVGAGAVLYLGPPFSAAAGWRQW